MIPLRFSIADARAAAHTAAPAVVFTLRVEQSAADRIHAVALRTQVYLDARSRRYSASDQERLFELFGESSQWDRHLRPVLWTQASVVVPAFEGRVDVDLPVPCTYDLEVAAAKYLHGVRDGTVPLLFLFTGTVFALGADGRMVAEPVPWDQEAVFRMPAQTWRDTMDRFFPGEGWIRVGRDTLDRLQAFRGRVACVTWDEALERLLDEATAQEEPA